MTDKLPMIYIATPIRSKDGLRGVARHIFQAWDITEQISNWGWAPFSPALNSAFMDSSKPDDHRKWMDIDLSILKRCDGIVLLPGWEQSEGCLEEREYAYRHNIPVYIWERDQDLLRYHLPPGSVLMNATP